MTHVPEIGAKNRYQFPMHMIRNLVPDFSGIKFLLRNRACSIFVLVYYTSFFLVWAFGADFWYVFHGH